MATQPRDATNGTRQRVPPHSLNSEAALLGAMMLSPDAVADVEGLVQSWHFYRPAHAAVFDAILSVAREGGKADAIVVMERLEQQHLDALDRARRAAVDDAGHPFDVQRSPICGDRERVRDAPKPAVGRARR